MTLGRMTGVDEDIPNNEDSTSTRRKIPKWTTKQNLSDSLFMINHAIVVSARPMGGMRLKRKLKKGKGDACLEVVNEEWNDFKQLKEKELENLEKNCQETEEANKLKKMEMVMKLSENEHLNDWSKKLLEKLNHELFGN
ncbi:hypothetical protein AT3G29645 [Arabidopsis thaliana]|uniref:Uncharacterized protein n=1 Tax=Arabidopsis thaliana TaxID=3702 RepID=A0A1I9LTS9_ARATH|nr:uncharacterized protein AT3G29645 [Arabidopsis thaliana]ANM65987.1 hypothetical protein AT3G29645 [Arabidopsis thaliana]|eukprot:NP_001327917.1 hypothetical protein AT3G29645 [Arabidopsis thaliana]